MSTKKGGLPPIGATIRRLRTERGLSQEALAARAGLDRGAIAKLETGQRRNPASQTLIKLSRALDVDLAALATPQNDEDPPALRAFLESPFADALAADGTPVTDRERRQLRKIVEAVWVEGKPTPQTLFKILSAIRENPDFTSDE